MKKLLSNGKKAFFFVVILFILWMLTAIALFTWPIMVLFPGRSELTDFKRLWKAIDQTANVFWLDGHNDETISSHAGRMIRAGQRPLWVRIVAWITEQVEEDHLEKAIESEFENKPFTF